MRIFVLGLSIIFLQASVAMGTDICDQERSPVIDRISAYDGSENQRREILSEYHYRRQFVNEACEDQRASEFEQAFLCF